MATGWEASLLLIVCRFILSDWEMREREITVLAPVSGGQACPVSSAWAGSERHSRSDMSAGGDPHSPPPPGPPPWGPGSGRSWARRGRCWSTCWPSWWCLGRIRSCWRMEAADCHWSRYRPTGRIRIQGRANTGLISGQDYYEFGVNET